METSICIHCIVKGRVQGVFYRQAAVEKAQELNLTGWVKNLPDGDVELMACGDEDTLELLRLWLWQGPPAAEVKEIFVQHQPMQDFTNFTVR